MRKGPNNASHVIWALGESFSISFVLFDTKQISIAYTGSKLQASGQPLPPYTIRTNGGSRCIVSRAQVSFPFPLYYFINNFILLQTKLLLYNSSIMAAPPQSQHQLKQGAGRGESKETAGEGNRGLRCIMS